MTFFLGLVVKVTFSFKPLGIEKIELFSKETEHNENLRYESLIVADPKYVQISSLFVLKINRRE